MGQLPDPSHKSHSYGPVLPKPCQVKPLQGGASHLVVAGQCHIDPPMISKPKVLPVAPVPKLRVNVMSLLVSIDPPYRKDRGKHNLCP